MTKKKNDINFIVSGRKGLIPQVNMIENVSEFCGRDYEIVAQWWLKIHVLLMTVFHQHRAVQDAFEK